MNKFRLGSRLRDERRTALGAAIHDWSAEPVDPETVSRLEERLSVALATPVTAGAANPKSSWLLGLSMAAAAVTLVLTIAHTQSHHEPRTSSSREVQTARAASTDVAFFGSSPRDVANAGPLAAALLAFR